VQADGHQARERGGFSRGFWRIGGVCKQKVWPDFMFCILIGLCLQAVEKMNGHIEDFPTVTI
jgi:hypothetical protein